MGLRRLWVWLWGPSLGIRDVLVVTGVGMVTFGAWWVYAPAGPVALGLGLIWLAVRTP